jgi:Glycosyl transferase family 11
MHAMISKRLHDSLGFEACVRQSTGAGTNGAIEETRCSVIVGTHDFSLVASVPQGIDARARDLACIPSVSIQVRGVDFVQHALANETHGSCDTAYYQDAWRRLTQLVPDARGFVLTDDPEWARETFAGWRSGVVVGAEFDGPAFMHKFHLMRSCRHHIIANSILGWWMTWLGSAVGKIIVMSTAWFRDMERSREAASLQVPGWIACDSA